MSSNKGFWFLNLACLFLLEQSFSSFFLLHNFLDDDDDGDDDDSDADDADDDDDGDADDADDVEKFICR